MKIYRRRAKSLPIASSLLLLLFCTTACHRQGNLQSPITKADLREEGGLARQLCTFPATIQEEWPPEFLEDIEKALHSYQGSRLLRVLRSQLNTNPQQFPLFPGYALKLRHVSLYDGHCTQYTLLAPLSENPFRPLFVVLGTPQDYPKEFTSLNAWILFIPSRPHLNYQLVAEGDFWEILHKVRTDYYPQMQATPCFLMGQDQAAAAALFFAEHYRYRFAGVLIGNPPTSLESSNLSQFPIFVFPVKGDSDATERGKHFVEKAQRGKQASIEFIPEGPCAAAKKILALAKEQAQLTPYAFHDYAHATVSPWLKVHSKQQEHLPASISGHIEGSRLVLNTQNVATLYFERSSEYPETEKITSVSFNHKLVSLPAVNGKFLIGEQSLLKNSEASPGGWINFFQKEPVYVVYQDHHASKEYLVETRKLAEQIASLTSYGQTATAAQLPLIPLSEYQMETFPPHRAIFVGQASENLPFITKRSAYLPAHLYQKMQTCTGYLIYPPEFHSSLVLALILTSPDTKGLQYLQSQYHDKAAFTHPFDLSLWQQQSSGWVSVEEERFSTDWKIPSREVSPVYQLVQPAKTWQTECFQLLMNKSRATIGILKPLFPKQVETASLGYLDIKEILQHSRYTVLSFTGPKEGMEANQFLHQLPPYLIPVGSTLLNPNSYPFEIDSKQIHRGETVRILINTEELAKLSAEQKKLFHPLMFPYALSELLEETLEPNLEIVPD